MTLRSRQPKPGPRRRAGRSRPARASHSAIGVPTCTGGTFPAFCAAGHLSKFRSWCEQIRLMCRLGGLVGVIKISSGSLLFTGHSIAGGSHGGSRRQPVWTPCSPLPAGYSVWRVSGRPFAADGKAFSRVCAGDAAVWVSPDCAISLSASGVSQLDLCASEHVAGRELDGADGRVIAAEKPPPKTTCLPAPICLVESTLDLLSLGWAECFGDPGT